MARTFPLFVAEISNTQGLSAYTLEGVKAGGYFTFLQGGATNGQTVTEYSVVNKPMTKVVHYRGATFTQGPPDTLSRPTPYRSTNNDADIPWTLDDLPLTVYVPASADVHEGVVTGWLAAARHALIRFGLWFKDNTPLTGYKQVTIQDGAGNSGDISVGVVNPTAHEVTLYGTPRGYIDGLGLSRNAVTPTTKLDIAAGEAMDSTNTVRIKLGTTLTKRTGGAWVAGNDANGMGNGLTIGNNAFYHVFAIVVNGLADVYFDTSVAAANKPVGTSYFRRLGSIRTNASAQLLDFVQVGDEFWLATPLTDYVGQAMTGGGATDTLTISVPQGVRSIWHGHAQVTTTTAGGVVSVSFHPSGFGAGQVNAGGGTNGTATTLAAGASDLHVLANASAQISGTATGAAVTMNVSTHGWRDFRGKE